MRLVPICFIFFGYALADSKNLNDLIDKVLIVAHNKIIDSKMDIVKISDISQNFTKDVGFMKLEGVIKCHNGFVQHLSTLKRTGDVIMSTLNGSILLDAKMGITDFYINFDKCQGVFNNMAVGSKVGAKIDGTSFDLKIKLTLLGKCDAKLETIKLVDIGKISINMDKGPFEQSMSQLLELFSNQYKNDIKKVVNSKIESKAKEAVTRTAKMLCTNIPH